MSISVKDSNGNFYKTASTPIVDSSLSSSSKNAIMNRAVYAALQGKVEITTANLVNYYLKSESYSKDEVDALVGGISTLSIKVVSELPTTDISTSTLYFVGPDVGTTNYTQYIYSDNTWVSLGSTAVDLSSYVTDDELTLSIADFVTEDQVQGMIANFYTKTEVDALVGNINLSELKDTSVVTPANGQILKYDSLLKKWVNGSTVVSTARLADIGDINITAIEDGDRIKWDATNQVWVNGPGAKSDWNESDSFSDAYIRNKPDLGTAATADATPSVVEDSTDVLTSGGAFDALADKVDKVAGKGLSENDYTNADKAIVDSVTNALASKVDTSSVGVASGVAELDANGKVPSSQLPSYVDDVKEGYLNSADGKFYEESTYETEITPETDKIYVNKATNIAYRWSGSAFVAIGSDLALGETSATAYRGDRGKAAYDHASDAGKISAATASGFYKVGATAEGHVSSLTAVTKADITALGIPDANNLGTAATKDSTSTIAQGSTDLPEAGAVYNMIPAQLSTTWEPKTWNGFTNLSGENVWTDGNNIYYSEDSEQYVLNKSTSTWTTKTWNGLTDFYGNSIWTDGDNIYSSSWSGQYVLDKSTSTWTSKTWNGFTNLSGANIWSDGDNIYFSDLSEQYVLNKSTSTWNTKTWNGLTDFSGYAVWSDGENIYYSYSSNQYVLNKSTSTWNTKTWNGLTSFNGGGIWTDGDNIYYSYGSENQYILNKATSTWEPKTWNGFMNLSGSDIWIDGDNIYCSYYSDQYTINKSRGFGSSATKNYTTSVISGNEDLITSGAVYNYVDSMITQALNAGY